MFKIVVAFGVVLLIASLAGVKFQCYLVELAYDRDPAKAAKEYGHETYEDWLASQKWYVRWVG
jgi:hypothetical protein